MADAEVSAREGASFVDVPLHVQPRARRTGLAGTHNGALKLKVQAPPVDDAANEAVVRFFSKLLDVPKSRLSIESGAKARDKILRIHGITLDSFRSRIASVENL